MKHHHLLMPVLAGLLGAHALAGGFQLNEHGARAMAQAGAFAARASDPSALFFNPAGLSFQRGFQIMGGVTLLAPRYTFYGPTNVNSNERWDMKDNVFTPVNAYVTNTWTDGILKGLGVGIGLVTPFGLGTEWDDDWVGKAVTREVDLESVSIMPTVSYAVNDWIAVGAGVNAVISSVLLRRAVPVFSPEIDLELEGDGDLAFSWNAGVLVRPLDNVSLGFTYRASTEVDYSGNARFASESTVIAALFPGGAANTSLTFPATWFAGIAWSPVEDLEIELDYQRIQWSSYDKLTIDFSTDAGNTPGVGQEDMTAFKNYQDTYILRAGGEYTLTGLGLTLRAGYFYDNNPVPDEYVEPLLPDSDRHGLNIGVGVQLTSAITLDAAYLDLLVVDRNADKTNHPEGANLNGLYTGNVQIAAVNLTYQF